MGRRAGKHAPDDAPPEFIEAVTSIIHSPGYEVRYMGMICGPMKLLGLTCPSLKAVEILRDTNGGTRARTLVHELAHVIMHVEEHTPYELAEVEAETVAFRVCTACGMSKAGYYQFPSTKKWAPGDFEATVAAIDSMVVRTNGTAQYILTRLRDFGFRGGREPLLGVACEEIPVLLPPEAALTMEVA